jgi:predicted nuclease with TOPRIM domain
VDNIHGQLDLDANKQGKMMEAILDHIHALEQQANNKEVRVMTLEHENHLLEERVAALEEKSRRMWEKMVNMHHDIIQV